MNFRFETDLRRGRNLATMGGGVAMGDFDGDGFLDLFFTGSVANADRARGGPVRRALPQSRRRDVRGRDGALGRPLVRLDDGRLVGGPRRRGAARPRRDRRRQDRDLEEPRRRDVSRGDRGARPRRARLRRGPRRRRRERRRARGALRRRLPRHGLREGELLRAVRGPHAGGLRRPGGEAERAGRGRPLRRARPGGRRSQHGRAGPLGGLLRLRRRRPSRPLRCERPDDERSLPQQGRRHVRGRDGRDRGGEARPQGSARRNGRRDRRHRRRRPARDPRHELRGRAEDALSERRGRALRRRDGVVRRRAAVASVRPVGHGLRGFRRRRAPRPRHGLGAPHPEVHHVDGEALREQQGPRPVRAGRSQLPAAARSLPQRGRRTAGGRDGVVRGPGGPAARRRAASRRATWTETAVWTSRSPPSRAAST